MPSKKSPTDFASTLTELEALASRLEGNETSLEQSLKDFENGIQLIRHAQKALQEAEQKVQILVEKDDNPLEMTLANEGEVTE